MKNTKLQNPSLRKRKGFTLIELIVVIAILAILAALAIPAFIGTLNKAKYKTHNANVMALRSAAAVAVAENGAPTGTSNIVWDSLGDGTTPFLSSNYVDSWPTNPMTNGTYTVTITVTTGAISVTPVKVNPDTGVAIS